MGELSERQKVARQKQKSEVVAHDEAPVDQMGPREIAVSRRAMTWLACSAVTTV
jgi:hypothetical protein